MATACTEVTAFNLPSSYQQRHSLERKVARQGPARFSADFACPGSARTGETETRGVPSAPAGHRLLDAGVRNGAPGNAVSSMFGQYSSKSTSTGGRDSTDGGLPAQTTANGSSKSERPGSLVGGPQYSPFMMYPTGPPVQGYMSGDGGAAGSPANMPGSPMSPGAIMMHPPFGNSANLGAPGSPHGYFASPNPFALHGTNGAPFPGSLPGDTPTAAQLPSFYVQAAAAAAAGLNGGGLAAGLPAAASALGPAGLGVPGGLGAGFSQTMSALLQGYSAPVGLDQQLSHPGGSLALDGSLASLGSLPPGTNAAVAAALLQQQQQQQHLLRRNLTNQASMLGLMGSSPLPPHLQHAAALQLSAAAASGLPQMPMGGHMSRLRVTHSADLALEGMGMGLGRQPSRFKPRKNSEPKIGPDGQPRLNARQRRTLRRARERALKGLLEVSQALLQKAEVPVKLPQDSHLSALMAAAEKEEKEDGYDSPNEDSSPDSRPQGGLDTNPTGSPGGSGGRKDAGGSSGSSNFPRGHELASAVESMEESVTNLAVAAVAAVAARYEGKDVSQAATAAQAAAAAAVNAANVLPPGYTVPEDSRLSEDGSVQLMVSPGSSRGFASSSGSGSTSPLPVLAPASSCPAGSSGLLDAVASRSVDAHRSGAGKPPPGRSKGAGGPAAGSGGGGGVAGSGAASGKGSSSQLDSIDISGLISQLSSKKDEGMVDDKLIRDLEIIQSLIGALKAPIPGQSGPASRPQHKQHLSSKRGSVYGPVGSGPLLQPTMSFPH